MLVCRSGCFLLHQFFQNLVRSIKRLEKQLFNGHDLLIYKVMCISREAQTTGKDNKDICRVNSNFEKISANIPVILMWSIYEIIHIWTAFVDESEECSSQFKISNLSNWKEEAWLKKSGLHPVKKSVLHDPVEPWIFSGFYFSIA